VTTLSGTVGAPVSRVEGSAKVTGAARYSGEIPLAGMAYGWAAQASIARGVIDSVDTEPVLAMPGVIGVLTHANAPRLTPAGDGELLLMQDNRVHYRGQVVALVVAETLEQARAAADALNVSYAAEPHDVILRADHREMYAPGHVNPNYPTDTAAGDVEAALSRAPVVVHGTYSTPAEHNNPMEPHAAIARWEGDVLTVWDSNQGPTRVHDALVTLFGLEPGSVRVITEHVGGGFGAKGTTRPHTVLAAMAARTFGRPVRVTFSRQQLFSLVGYRTPTIQQVRLGAAADGRLMALDHLAYSQTSTVVEFAEQTAVISRVMYAAPSLRTRHRLVALDVPTPRWMRAPGECPGAFALECAMDELAEACAVDPIELRVRNEPAVEPEGGRQFSSRHLLDCLAEGARRFAWADRDPRPGVRRDGRWLTGTGVASATYPARSMPSTATVTALPDGSYEVAIAAADIGQGARTAITQVAADELGVDISAVRANIGDSDYGPAMIAGGSMGMASWSWAVAAACRQLRAQLPASVRPAEPVSVRADTTSEVAAMPDLVRHSFGAQFAEVRVDIDTGEIRVPRLLGVFAAGRILNPKTARSQLIGGMTMGLSMALHEESVMDAQFGDYLNHDFAGYHIAAHADVRAVEAYWIEESDGQLNPLGVKGLGEVGIVGAAAAIANAVWHATGCRQRKLPILPARILTRPAPARSDRDREE
jgi:xanthine dehydrogenase YagR molybdenum-binding subunit